MRFSLSNSDSCFNSDTSKTLIIIKEDGERFSLNIDIYDNIISLWADELSMEIDTQSTNGDVDIVINSEEPNDKD
jgi:hypothetical protein